MTHVVELTLKFTSSQELLVLAKANQKEVQSYVEFPPESDDLIAELRSGKSIQSALEQAQHMVTDTLFSGEIIDLILDELDRPIKEQGSTNFLENSAPHTVLMLSTPDELHSWPWELALHPISKRSLLLSQVEIIRVVGKIPSPQEKRRLHLLKNGRVLTKRSEVFKFSAMKAATSHIARKFKVDVTPIHQRNMLTRESQDEMRLFNHVYAIDKNGLITLETESGEGALSLSDSSIAQESVFLNITPPIPSREVVNTRRVGSMVIISRQFEQSVKTRAESDRALYHALGSGFSFVHALHWARHALHQSEPEGYQWATLVLTTGLEKSYPTILESFPPQFSSSEASLDKAIHKPASIAQDHQTDLAEGQVILSKKRRPSAIPVVQFVHETVALIQKSQQSGDELDKIDLALRTPMMRQLSAIVQKRKIKANPSLQRSVQLSQQLIEAGHVDDEVLRLPNQWYGRAQRLADALGIQVDPVAQSTRALVSSPAIWVCGADAYTRLTFARGLCEEIFQAFPHEPLEHTVYNQASPSIDLSLVNGLSKVSELSWSKCDANDDISTRQMIISFHEESNSWRRYRRAFLLIDQAQRLSQDAREMMMVTLRSHYLARPSNTDQLSTEIKVPKETKVIYISEFPPAGNRGEVVLSLTMNTDRLRHLWYRDLRSLLVSQSIPLETIEKRLNNPLTQAFTSLLCLALRLNLLSPTLAFDALHYGVVTGADIATFTESIELYVYPQIGTDDLKRDCLYSYAQQDQEGFEASWIALYPEQTPPDLPLLKLTLPILFT